MKKRKKKNVVQQKGRRIYEAVKKTLFGEKLKSAIDKPVPAKAERPVHYGKNLVETISQAPLPKSEDHTSSPVPHTVSTPSTKKEFSGEFKSYGSYVDTSLPKPKKVGKRVSATEQSRTKRPSQEVQEHTEKKGSPVWKCESGQSSGISLKRESIEAYRQIIEVESAKTRAATFPWIKLGIDLGTSSSKVVWRSENSVKPVCFGSDTFDLASYLLPSLVSFHKENIAHGFEAAALPFNSRVSNFKMCLACVSAENGGCGPGNCTLTDWRQEHFCEEISSQEVSFVNAVYLARLFTTTKQKIENELQKEFAIDVDPKWTVNLAVPETYISESPIAQTFREVLRTAWFMSDVFDVEPQLVDRTKLFECYVAAREYACESLEILDDATFGCSLYPEIGGEVASIVMPRTSEEGLYAFVDVGAGTVDASVFRYFRDGSAIERPPFAAAVSKDLGASQIELQGSKCTYQGVKYNVGDLKRIKEGYRGFTAEEKKEYAPHVKIMRHVSKQLRPKLQDFLEAVFGHARHKEPGIVNQKIRLVLGGGGSGLATYQKAAQAAFTSKSKVAPVEPEITVLRKPDDFSMSPLPEADFHRFAVAYGLSYPFEDLPKPILTKEVLPVQGPRKVDRNRGAWYEK